MDRVWQERAIRSWFSMWLEGKAGDLTALFTPDVQYIESWGPEYRGVSQVRHWFQEWNTRGRVLVWELRSILHDGDRSVAEGYFKNTVDALPDPLERRREDPQASGIWLPAGQV